MPEPLEYPGLDCQIRENMTNCRIVPNVWFEKQPSQEGIILKWMGFLDSLPGREIPKPVDYVAQMRNLRKWVARRETNQDWRKTRWLGESGWNFLSFYLSFFLSLAAAWVYFKIKIPVAEYVSKYWSDGPVLTYLLLVLAWKCSGLEVPSAGRGSLLIKAWRSHL